MMNKCPQCLTVLPSWKATICTHCGYDIKNKIETWKQADFNEYKLPWILLAFGFLLNLGALLYFYGTGRVLLIVFYVAILLLLQIPVMIGFLTIVGKIFGIDFGPVSVGMVKLAAITMLSAGLNSLLQLSGSEGKYEILFAATLLYYVLFIALFNLSLSEAGWCWLGLIFIATLTHVVVTALPANFSH